MVFRLVQTKMRLERDQENPKTWNSDVDVSEEAIQNMLLWKAEREAEEFEREQDKAAIREDAEWYAIKSAAKREWIKIQEEKAQEEILKSLGNVEMVLESLTENRSSALCPLTKASWEQVDAQTGVRRVRAIVDSGASQSCASNELAPEIIPTPSEGSRRGQTYAAAGGKALPNEGEKDCTRINCRWDAGDD